MDYKQNKLQAIAEGKATYMGTPCIQGHDGKRYVRNGDCFECRKIAKRKKTPSGNIWRAGYSREYYKKNRDKLLARQKKWRATERGKAIEREKRAKRRVLENQRTPSWADPDAIRCLYQEALRKTLETGIVHHVDHIIPIKGKLVSGLHIETNLQVIPAEDNIKKSNKYQVE